MVEKNERKSADSNELADYLTTKRIEFSYSTGKLGKLSAFCTTELESIRQRVEKVVSAPNEPVRVEPLDA